MNKTYGGDSIEVLDGLEPVRVRPGMYIGSTDKRGLHHLIWEIVDNSVDEHLAGYCNQIIVTHEKNGGISVEDNGRGIPVEINTKKGVPAVRLVLTVLHAGGKFDTDNYAVSGGLHGVGASVVNALSESFIAEIWRDGHSYVDKYKDGGHPQTELNKDNTLPETGSAKKTGTKISFKPDKTIFDETEFDDELILEKLKEKVYLNPELRIIFENKSTGTKVELFEPDGIKGMVNELIQEETKLIEPFLIRGKSGTTHVEIAFAYVEEAGESIVSFCNDIPTINGGTHVTGLRGGITRLINGYARDLDLAKESFDGKDVRNGFRAVISIKHINPLFEGQTKEKLNSSDAKSAVEDVISKEAARELDKRVVDIQNVIEHVKWNMKRREKEAKSQVDIQSKEVRLQSNGKIAMCLKRDPKKNELFIVEGDSAGGTAKQGRNRTFQAVLPLKGKILNIEKASMDRIMANEEIQSLFVALGCGFGENFDAGKCNFDKIIFLTDADVDGSHIRILLLTLFYRYAKDLVTEGKVYRSCPPLFKVNLPKKGKEPQFIYAYSDSELRQIQKKYKSKITGIQRYKGLGEMSAEQLWETTLNPETRSIMQVHIDNPVKANNSVELLMGKKVEPRKNFIIKNAHRANI